MQYKIPQEVDIEDKIIGPFTLKGFGFIFAAVVTAITFLVILVRIGLPFLPAAIIGIFFGSFFLIVGFVPFNGRPAYTFTLPLIHYLTKPRQRVWKKELETEKAQNVRLTNEAKPKMDAPEVKNPVKEPLSSVEQQIEDISLTVDTGGSYDSAQTGAMSGQTQDMFDESGKKIERELEKAREEVETKGTSPEPTISKMASVDPEKKFNYEYPDTSKYNIDEKLNLKDK